MRPRKCMWPLRLATSVTKQGNITSIIRTYKPKRKSDHNLGVVNQGNITYHYGSDLSVYRTTTYKLMQDLALQVSQKSNTSTQKCQGVRINLRWNLLSARAATTYGGGAMTEQWYNHDRTMIQRARPPLAQQSGALWALYKPKNLFATHMHKVY